MSNIIKFPNVPGREQAPATPELGKISTHAGEDIHLGFSANIFMFSDQLGFTINYPHGKISARLVVIMLRMAAKRIEDEAKNKV